MIKNKKGSHVGIILSFVIFIFFVLSLYLILSPTTQKKEEKKQILEYASAGLINASSSELISNVLKVDSYTPSNPGINCIQIKSISNKNSIVYFVSGASLTLKDSYPTPTNLMIKNTDNGVYKIFQSDKFALNNNLAGCEAVPDNKYNLGATKTEKYIFIADFESLVAEYDLNDASYLALKDKLNIPAGTEFWFELVKEDGTKISTDRREEVKDIEKYKKEINIEYFDSNANIKLGYLNFEVY